MKRRVFLASSLAGLSMLSGCMDMVFGGNEDEDPDETPADPSPQEDVFPHRGMSESGVDSTFIDDHFNTLTSRQNYTVEYVEETESDSTKRTVWKRDGSDGYVQIYVDESIVEERYYADDGVMGRQASLEGLVNLFEQAIPNPTVWAKAQIVREILENSKLTFEQRTDAGFVYVGQYLNNESDTSSGVRVVVHPDLPFVTDISFTESDEMYSISDVSQTVVTTPQWFEAARSDQVAVTGGIFTDANAVNIKISEASQALETGSVITVIFPDGTVKNVNITEEVQPGDTIHIAFRVGIPVYDINQLPSVSDRDQLPEGTYIVTGVDTEGNHLFEIELYN